ncbi:(2Fe-2S)-binding protein [Candidatus Micrarchaeota archaeon]|nr:(2Fe-2S)-binding protein [Candidatus Micrarchaeota archaeon]
MAKITIKNEIVTFQVPDGEKALEYIKKNSNMLFGCEQGYCGTCLCSVVSGMENLSKKTDEEQALLPRMNANPNQRLGCQMRVIKGEVVLEY